MPDGAASKKLRRITILHEDDACIVVAKPAGLPVQGGKGVGVSLDSLLADAWTERPLLVHRLDRDTSGIVLVAKNKTSAAAFSKLFGSDEKTSALAEKGVVKRYLAVCKGTPSQAEGTINLDLAVHGTIKKSATRYKLLATYSREEPCSLLELELGTGRMHQIRRHLALTGNPILGDDKYGDFPLNRKLRKTMQLRRLLLHASHLIIPKMPDGSRLEVSAPLPDYFDAFLSRL
jgi:23S rRNA pseudouridine955/2504/2580 synthase